MGHHHHHAEPGRALGWALALNGGFLLVEVVIGVLSGSIAVLSDAGHMVADVAALAIAYVAQRLARLKGSSEYTFGLRRLPILGGLANALTLNGIVILIVVFALQRFREPAHVDSAPVLVAGVIGLFVNVAGAWVLHRRGGESVNVRGAMMHLVADALGSVGVIVSGVVLATTGWLPIDPLVSLVIAAMIGFGTWPLVRDLVRTLLLGSPSALDPDRVRSVFLEDSAVRCLEDFHLWELDTDYVVLSARVHTNVTELAAADALVKRIGARLKQEFRIHHVTIEVGPHREGEEHGENDCLSLTA
ncbi:cation diffusion facilitator family transporter [Myxococcota bacterium]|nr:cation diffusion facilitator family transporter [Myxococcota bacterium]